MIYMIYTGIEEDVYNEEIKYLLPQTPMYRWKDNKLYGLYAWTTKKKLLNEFMEVRSNGGIYTVKEQEETEELLYAMNDRYTLLKLNYYKFQSVPDEKGNKTISIVTTKNEYVITTEDGMQFIYSDFTEYINSIADYRMCNDSIMDALGRVGYNEWYDSIFGVDDPDIISLIDWNRSFGTTTFYRIMDLANEYDILIYLFRYMFTGCRRKG